MNIVLLSGGSGKRLWPLSNDVRSKQFLKLLCDGEGNHESMVQRVYRQIVQAGIDADIVVATSSTQVEAIRGQLQNDVDIVVEPERRNTFPAIVLAASYLESRKKMDPEETVIVLPVDPYVDVEYFETFKKMDERVQQGDADIVLMGIKPSYPSEKYGYIIQGEAGSVTGFKEKPAEEAAAGLIEQGALWNAGVFAFKLKYLMRIADKYVSSRDFSYVVNHYTQLKKDSFDYEVVENADSLAVVPYNGAWKDIGTWNTLTEEMKEESIGDTIMGEECVNTHVINELSIPVVALGTQNLVIAASQDGILVSDKHKSSYIKPYVENLNNRPMYEERRWGEYKVYDYSQYADGTKSLTKHITINAGCAQDYQVHRYKDEVITVVNGCGELVIDGCLMKLSCGDTISIKRGQKHGIRAFQDLQLISVQIGEDVAEDDVEVLSWSWAN
ncbi:MAG: cupin domain-containing protein [Lachnospiraceae bacterium]|nr:cupin domain-containing protein [Lachnospiraceae bacterium]MBO5145842.1 cupin domain-containing protein [Lachnospiraceae bacterium]